MAGIVDRTLEALRYRLLSRVIHHPALLRAVARLLQQRPGVARLLHVVCERDPTLRVFQRQWSFTTTQAPNMRAGEFVIGMEAGERQRRERDFLEQVLPAPDEFGRFAADESRIRIERLKSFANRTFDLVGDYLVHVAWAPLAEVLGRAAADEVVAAGGGETALYDELRAVGAQLIVGSTSPRPVLERAEACAAALNRRVNAARASLGPRWSAKPLGDDPHAVLRNAVGLLWVAHPATVQAGALCMQQLLQQPGALQPLAERVQARARGAADDPWTDDAVRNEVRDHALELLRLRPPFPILTRNVPRETWFALAPGVPAGHAPAGSTMTILLAGALAHAAGADPARYCPGRAMCDSDRHLMFGYGERVCIAKDHVVEVLTSALIGLLTLPRLHWGGARRLRYDGPTIVRMPLRYGP